ncbi:hypothetical protein E2C01_002649 [Portunus trituberculatus]|uniref:Uncharacterized protein n=1 Tax=Portunus trituberculatus TaxID=210409 RepID=A0A5B7CLA8_PORTR|nr:hypothetical protein [Portunus trituberculatus]
MGLGGSKEGIQWGTEGAKKGRRGGMGGSRTRHGLGWMGLDRLWRVSGDVGVVKWPVCQQYYDYSVQALDHELLAVLCGVNIAIWQGSAVVRAWLCSVGR